MTVKERYESAKEIYAKAGVDTDKALEILKGNSGIHALLAGRRCNRL